MTAKPFLILQLRPEDEAADDELAAIIRTAGIDPNNVHRVRMERESIPPLNPADYTAVIVGGGPFNVSDNEADKTPEQKRFEHELYTLLDTVVETDLPYLGACYGLGILAKYLGGKVSKERYGEPVSAVTIKLTEAGQEDLVTIGLPTEFRAFGGHKESCQAVPPHATLLASSPDCPVHMIRVKQNIYGTQFHTELDKAGLALRINIYKEAGYFPPEDADKLIAAAQDEEVVIPAQILQRFVQRAQELASRPVL